MPIVSHRTGMDVMQADGTRKVHWYFIDHTGKEYAFRMRNVPAEFDEEAERPNRAAIYDQKLLKWESRRVEQEIEKGADPASITLDHLTNRQAVKPLVKAFMRMYSSPESVRTAEWIRDNVTNAVLDADFSPQVRQRVRNRITDLVAMKADLITDDGRREELE